jgi:hypothetical protein
MFRQIDFYSFWITIMHGFNISHNLMADQKNYSLGAVFFVIFIAIGCASSICALFAAIVWGL